MSKDIIIQEGGVNKNLNSIKKILTDEQGGGSCNWVPEEEVQRGTKTITKNGTYKASDDDLYGYSKVTVKVKGGSGGGISSDPGSGVSGTNPSDGNDYAHEIDDNGEIVTTKLPTRIVMSSLPYDTSYVDGETINFTGAEVTAYYEDGSSYGVVPFEELTFEPTVADSSGGNEYSDGDGVNCIAITYEYIENSKWSGWGYPNALGTQTGGSFGDFPASLGGGSGSATLLVTRYNNYTYVKRIAGDNNHLDLICYHVGQTVYGLKDGWFRSGTTTATSSTTQFKNTTWREYLTNVPESTKDPNNAGNILPTGNRQEISVSWPRIKDEKVLTTSFTITVEPSSNGQSGSSSGSGSSSSGGEDSGGGGSHGF